ncbi:MAG: diacylglycerol/lipid kinase family protein [Candidatus Aquicultorales bacterium]
MRLYVIVNPISGGGRGLKALPDVTAVLDQTGVEYEIAETERRGHGFELAKSAAGRGFSRILCVGGDGLVNEVLNGVVGTDAEVALVKAGGCNDFGSVIGIPADPGRAAKLAVEGQAVAIDVGEVNGRYFFEISGVGFDSLVTERSLATPWLRGRSVYIYSIVRTLFGFKPALFTIETPETTVRTRAMMVAVGNGPSYGGGMKVTTGARHDDGLFHVCVVGAVSIPHFLLVFPRVFNGSHVKSRAVSLFKAAALKVEADREMPVFADGEYVGVLPAVFKVHPRAVPVVAPAYAPEITPVLKPSFAAQPKTSLAPSTD